MKNNKATHILLIVLGIIIIALSQILSREYNLSDITQGIIKGVGFGFIIATIINLSKNRAKKTND